MRGRGGYWEGEVSMRGRMSGGMTGTGKGEVKVRGRVKGTGKGRLERGASDRVSALGRGG